MSQVLPRASKYRSGRTGNLFIRYRRDDHSRIVRADPLDEPQELTKPAQHGRLATRVVRGRRSCRHGVHYMPANRIPDARGVVDTDDECRCGLSFGRDGRSCGLDGG